MIFQPKPWFNGLLIKSLHITITAHNQYSLFAILSVFAARLQQVEEVTVQHWSEPPAFKRLDDGCQKGRVTLLIRSHPYWHNFSEQWRFHDKVLSHEFFMLQTSSASWITNKHEQNSLMHQKSRQLWYSMLIGGQPQNSTVCQKLICNMQIVYTETTPQLHFYSREYILIFKIFFSQV